MENRIISKDENSPKARGINAPGLFYFWRNVSIWRL